MMKIAYGVTYSLF